ncbi:60S ribosomal subunit assembly/export protein [Didymella heteroderae]|uniref:60S ribosomal subunit assembly/export protein n=1 Tax=Didymella heteroderae TaxID=1769908 RepID=A0A9P4WK38_9PLEO|nr:60S ribosomal subunit assembly/export protein [Didymella heteroderae]
MAPTKPSSKGKSGPKGKSAGVKPKAAGKKPEGISKNRQKKLSLAKPGGEQKTKSNKKDANKKKKRVYTEAELDIPKLNSIVPAGIAKPKGQKKGKVFVDDPASMMAIMSVVNAQKEGHIESKIMRARQLEEIREAKRKEAEGRADEKKADFEDRKQSLKKKRKRNSEPARTDDADAESPKKNTKKDGKFKPKKRVSFG